MRSIASAAVAFVSSAAFFTLVGVVSTDADRPLAIALIPVAALATLVVARRWGVAYAVPLVIASLFALDWFLIPPTHELAVPTAANAVAVCVYLAIAVLIGQLAERAWRRAHATEVARGRLADEREALHRVATLVAQGVPPSETVAAVTEEVSRLLGTQYAAVGKLDPDGPALILVGRGQAPERWVLDDSLASAKVLRSGRAARADESEFASATGPTAERLRTIGAVSSAASPIVVDGRLWGVIAVASRERLPVRTESRLASFAELVGMAIANADSRAQLIASRARVVAAADDARRRVERDIHDGVQQQLVALALELRALDTIVPPEQELLRGRLTRVGERLADALEELRTISRGLHPAILSRGGLALALKGLARRSPLAVDLDVRLEGRPPERVEVAAYYVVSEALANAAKHAGASSVQLRVEASNGTLILSIRDDGVGGAYPARGSGLIGLTDRVAATGGTISVVSPPGEGTRIDVTLPLSPSEPAAEAAA